ncbi:outer membrane lipoprotein carrier protein LolA [Aestuariibacter sp. A3R04]|uniref:outer membrane lipoprotein carrier protein LolA n=1 Tax=Aestuariibacter sp. A3R04 TaxID=2841571 RepID=UPI001C0A2376|nr:outer membrane lipoprotein carrier protein LolA [Aestuariibacter sp. A3R04]MBU3020487.1 outer membrane lipoprotein carrier protein LolA [Aestuariibacter sp. A3R04]
MTKIYPKWFASMLFLGGLSGALAAKDTQPEDEALLASVFPSGCHFSGQFTQKKAIEGLPVPLMSTGDFYYSCDLGLVWHTSEPFKDAILYVNGSNNFRADETGALTPLTGTTRYIMSNIFVRLLKGDTQYFTEEFAISPADDNAIVMRPHSDMMRRGLDSIHIQKKDTAEAGVSLDIAITDATGQLTSVSIADINEYAFEGKRSAYEQCQTLYSDTATWCQVLRSPARYKSR